MTAATPRARDGLRRQAGGCRLATLGRLVDEGRLRVVTDRVFPFEQITDAFASLEQGHAKGKVIVRMNPA